MQHLINIAERASPTPGVQFRRTAYGKKGIRDFLRDVVAIANASVEGTRYIIVGVEVDPGGKRSVPGVDRNDFKGKPSYHALVNEFVEPPVRLRYQPVEVRGKTIGVYEIGDCQDRPYMLRIDHCETLRRGDAYMRVNDQPVKLGRRQLQALFEEKFRESVSGSNVEIGFPGDILHKDGHIATSDLDELPSRLASAKLEELIKARRGGFGATTTLVRLTHARLFGSDNPFEDREVDELLRELDGIGEQYREADTWFLYEERAEELQLALFNQGDEALRDASVTITLPNHDAIHVAPELPPTRFAGRFSPRDADEQADYPTVSFRDDAVHVSVKLGDVAPGEMRQLYATPLRLCVGSELKGRRIGVNYTLFAQNLRTPATGRLRLFMDAGDDVRRASA